jgi:hypothetical protein
MIGKRQPNNANFLPVVWLYFVFGLHKINLLFYILKNIASSQAKVSKSGWWLVGVVVYAMNSVSDHFLWTWVRSPEGAGSR